MDIAFVSLTGLLVLFALFILLELLKKNKLGSRWPRKYLPIIVGIIVMEACVLRMSYHSSNRLSGEEKRQGSIRAGSEHELGGSRWDLMDCINKNQDDTRPTTWESALSPRSASLRVVSIWWSIKPATIPLTITTQMSAARLWQLKAICMQYPGPVSAVLYVGSLKSKVLHEHGLVSIMVRQAEALFKSMELAGQCKLDLMLVRETFEDKEAKLWYPVNQLRNYARLQARTPLLGIVDADLLVSPLLAEEFGQASRRKFYLDQLTRRQEKVVYVLPAFQVPYEIPREESMVLADRSVSLKKDILKQWFDKGNIVQFDPGKPGHAATNYSRWFSPEGGAAYPVQYEKRYEPWVLCDRFNVPWHDHLFKGYGLNKIIHLEHMNNTGYRFLVHPSAFLIHRAHRSTHAKNLVITAKAKAKEAKSEQDNATKEGGSVDAEVHQGKDQREDWLWEQLLQKAALSRSTGQLSAHSIIELEEDDDEYDQNNMEGGKSDETVGIARRSLLAEEITESGKTDTIEGPKSTYAHTQMLGTKVRRRMVEGNYEPLIDGAVRACLETLPWWKHKVMKT